MHKYDFSQISNVKVYFVKSIGFFYVSRIQRCFHGLSSQIRSEFMADQT